MPLQFKNKKSSYPQTRKKLSVTQKNVGETCTRASFTLAHCAQCRCRRDPLYSIRHERQGQWCSVGDGQRMQTRRHCRVARYRRGDRPRLDLHQRILERSIRPRVFAHHTARCAKQLMTHGSRSLHSYRLAGKRLASKVALKSII